MFCPQTGPCVTHPDYGIDGQVEVFDVNNKATGLMFLIQLKATDALDLSDALSVQFRLDTLVPGALLQSAIIEAAKGHSDLITFSSENPLGAHPMVIIEEERITVTRSGLTSVTYQTKEYSPDLALTKLPHDILTAVAFVFRINGQAFLEALSRLANQQPAKFPADELMDTIWEVVNSVELPADNFEVRVLGDGPSYQSLKLGPGLIPKLTPADTPNQPLTETQ